MVLFSFRGGDFLAMAAATAAAAPARQVCVLAAAFLALQVLGGADLAAATFTGFQDAGGTYNVAISKKILLKKVCVSYKKPPTLFVLNEFLLPTSIS